MILKYVWKVFIMYFCDILYKIDYCHSDKIFNVMKKLREKKVEPKEFLMKFDRWIDFSGTKICCVIPLFL